MNWRSSRRRAAPSAERTATSRTREVPRTRSRLATFPHATTSTNAAAASRAHSAGRTRPSTTSVNGSRCAPRALFDGYARSRRVMIAATSSRAPASDTPRREAPERQDGMRVARQRLDVGRHRQPEVHARSGVTVREPAPVVGGGEPLQHAGVGRIGQNADDGAKAFVEPHACDPRPVSRARRSAPVSAR